MEAAILFGLLFLAIPILLPIIALIRAASANSRAGELQRKVEAQSAAIDRLTREVAALKSARQPAPTGATETGGDAGRERAPVSVPIEVKPAAPPPVPPTMAAAPPVPPTPTVAVPFPAPPPLSAATLPPSPPPVPPPVAAAPPAAVLPPGGEVRATRAVAPSTAADRPRVPPVPPYPRDQFLLRRPTRRRQRPVKRRPRFPSISSASWACGCSRRSQVSHWSSRPSSSCATPSNTGGSDRRSDSRSDSPSASACLFCVR